MITWVYFKYKLISTYNKLSASLVRKKTTTRGGTARKRATALLFMVSMAFIIFALYSVSAANIQEAVTIHTMKPVGSADSELGFNCEVPLSQAQLKKRQARMEAGKTEAKPAVPSGFEKLFDEEKTTKCEKRPAVAHTALTDSFNRYLAIKLFFVILCSILSIFVVSELAAAEWDLEWLFTMPLSSVQLMRVRIIEHTILNGFVFLFLIPLVSLSLYVSRVPIAIVIVGTIVSYFAISFFVGCLQTVVGTGSRLFLRPSRLKNWQAMMSVISVLAGIGLMFPEFDRKFLHPVSTLSLPVMDWLPSGLLALIITTTSWQVTLTSVGVLAVQLVVTYLLSVLVLRFLLRNGITVMGFQDSSRSTAEKERRRHRGVFSWTWLGPVVRKELALLARDRTLMVQTTILPFAMVVLNIYLALKGGFEMNVNILAATTFGTACYAMITATFQVLITETKTLWLISALPYPLERILFKKIYPWIVFLILFPVPVFLVKFGLQELLTLRVLGIFAFTTVGILIFSVISTCFGYFAVDPFSDRQRARISPGYLYLFMLLAGFYGFAIWKEDSWTRFVLLFLTSGLAVAFWQRMRDSSIYLQDPTAQPPARVAMVDGIVGALLFFIVQASYTFTVQIKIKSVSLSDLFIAYAIAGWVMFGALKIYYFLFKSLDVPRFFGEAWKRSVAIGTLTGLALGALTHLYVLVAEHYEWFVLPAERAWVWKHSALIFIAMVFAAPVFEEFLFRGVIYSSLRRITKPVYAVLGTATIFAIVHPLDLVLPMFVLGVASTLLYKNTRMLLGSVAMHVSFNALIFILLILK